MFQYIILAKKLSEYSGFFNEVPVELEMWEFGYHITIILLYYLLYWIL